MNAESKTLTKKTYGCVIKTLHLPKPRYPVSIFNSTKNEDCCRVIKQIGFTTFLSGILVTQSRTNILNLK